MLPSPSPRGGYKWLHAGSARIFWECSLFCFFLADRENTNGCGPAFLPLESTINNSYRQKNTHPIALDYCKVGAGVERRGLPSLHPIFPRISPPHFYFSRINIPFRPHPSAASRSPPSPLPLLPFLPPPSSPSWSCTKDAAKPVLRPSRGPPSPCASSTRRNPRFLRASRAIFPSL
ncbi:hypothetical protein Naga_102003g1 [Nannochloropsis gaditana]|uniref:Uncharacterized protein n=1 Tax=Nannochloropsis gaditana TaxID=72520 RepID=W7TDR7_9STRA|nr:hypothetical protein Naga_102003g1 [Nannochloropsis gaditana]